MAEDTSSHTERTMKLEGGRAGGWKKKRCNERDVVKDRTDRQNGSRLPAISRPKSSTYPTLSCIRQRVLAFFIFPNSFVLSDVECLFSHATDGFSHLVTGGIHPRGGPGRSHPFFGWVLDRNAFLRSLVHHVRFGSGTTVRGMGMDLSWFFSSPSVGWVTSYGWDGIQAVLGCMPTRPPPFQWDDLSSCIHPMPRHTTDGPSMPRPSPSDPTMGIPPSSDPSPCTDEERRSSASHPTSFPLPWTFYPSIRWTRTACDEYTAWGSIPVVGNRIDLYPSPFPSDGPSRSFVSIRRPPTVPPPPPSLPRPPSVPVPDDRNLVSGSIGPTLPFRKGR